MEYVGSFSMVPDVIIRYLSPLCPAPNDREPTETLAQKREVRTIKDTEVKSDNER